MYSLENCIEKNRRDELACLMFNLVSNVYAFADVNAIVFVRAGWICASSREYIGVRESTLRTRNVGLTACVWKRKGRGRGATMRGAKVEKRRVEGGKVWEAEVVSRRLYLIKEDTGSSEKRESRDGWKKLLGDERKKERKGGKERERGSETGLRFLSNYLPFAFCQPRSLSTSAICPRDSHHLSLPPFLHPISVQLSAFFPMSDFVSALARYIYSPTVLPFFVNFLPFPFTFVGPFLSRTRNDRRDPLSGQTTLGSLSLGSSFLSFFLPFPPPPLFFLSSLLPVDWFRRPENSESRQGVSRTLRSSFLIKSFSHLLSQTAHLMVLRAKMGLFSLSDINDIEVCSLNYTPM